MEDTVVLDTNGRELEQADVTALGDSAGRADDRVFAELLRMTPFVSDAPRKGILPYNRDFALSPFGVVIPGTAGARQVNVQPFRAFVGSRVVAASGAKTNWRDIRSGLPLSDGDTSLTRAVALAANSSGNPRWDIVYAAVSIDVPVTGTRLRKDPTTVPPVVSPGTYVTKTQTTVSIGVVQGTPGASPAVPSTPSDAAGTYYIPLAAVRVASGQVTFTANDIWDRSDVLHLSPSTGAAIVHPANGISSPLGHLLAFNIPWPASGARPGPFMPAGMSGCDTIFFGLQLAVAQPQSAVDQTVIDDSRDWRNRIFKWQAYASSGAVACDSTGTTGALLTPDGGYSDVNVNKWGINEMCGMGQTMYGNAGGDIANTDSEANICVLSPAKLSVMGASSKVRVYVDRSLSSGSMRIGITGTPNVNIFLWIEASAPMPNK